MNGFALGGIKVIVALLALSLSKGGAWRCLP
jgi:hypothetical protein